MLPIVIAQLRYFAARNGKSPFEDWFLALNSVAAAKVTIAFVRLEQGNWSNVKGVGGGVLECRIDWGPGYRIYFGRNGDELVILLTGGTKKRQDGDIKSAQAYWVDYKQRRLVMREKE